MLKLVKDKFLKRVGMRIIEYQYKNFAIRIEIDEKDPSKVMYFVTNKQCYNLSVYKTLHEQGLIAVDSFITGNPDEADTLAQELRDAGTLLPLLDELEKTIESKDK